MSLEKIAKENFATNEIQSKPTKTSRRVSNLVNWLIYGDNPKSWEPVSREPMIEHCPFCKKPRYSINKDCEDQRFHKQK